MQQEPRLFNSMSFKECEEYVKTFGKVVKLLNYPGVKNGNGFCFKKRKTIFKVKLFTNIDREKGGHKFHLSIKNLNGFTFDVCIDRRRHKIGCEKEHCNSYCLPKNNSIIHIRSGEPDLEFIDADFTKNEEEKQIEGEPDEIFSVVSEQPEGEPEKKFEDNTEMRNDVAWCISHPDYECFVKEITHIKTGSELIVAFNGFDSFNGFVKECKH